MQFDVDNRIAGKYYAFYFISMHLIMDLLHIIGKEYYYREIDFCFFAYFCAYLSIKMIKYILYSN